MIDIVKVMNNLCPGAKWTCRGNDYEGIEWNDTVQNKPTKEEFLAEANRVFQEFKSNEYQRKRQREYPPLTELADALYHQQNGDDSKMTAYLAKVEAVKQKYPKE